MLLPRRRDRIDEIRSGMIDVLERVTLCGINRSAPRRLPGVNWFRRGLQSSSGHAEAQVLVNPTAIANLTANDETYALAA